MLVRRARPTTIGPDKVRTMTSSHETASSDSSAGAGSPFPATLWEPVLRAAQGDSPAAQEALRSLCVTYRQPIYSFLRRRGRDHHQAEEQCSGFIEFLLEKNRFQGFVRTSTKFRSFLITCLNNYLGMLWRAQAAAKRGGGVAPAEFEDGSMPSPAEESAGGLDRDIALRLHQLVLDQIEEKYTKTGKRDRFQALQGVAFGETEGDGYAEIAQSLGLTANHVRQEVFRLRNFYYDSFRAQVARTTAPDDVEDEMRYLVSLIPDPTAPEAIPEPVGKLQSSP